MPSKATPQPMVFRISLKADPRKKIAPILLNRLQLTIQRKLPYPWPSSAEDQLRIGTVGSSQSLVSFVVADCSSIEPLDGDPGILQIEVEGHGVYDLECQDPPAVIHEAIFGVQSNGGTCEPAYIHMQLCLSLVQFMCVKQVFLGMLAKQWGMPTTNVSAKAAEIASDKVDVKITARGGSPAELVPTFAALFLQRLLTTTTEQTKFKHSGEMNDIFLQKIPPPPGCTQ
jgi:hypothetical protein